MKSAVAAFTVCLLALSAAPAVQAQARSRVIYSHKAWEVRLVRFDSGAYSCMAKVSNAHDSFSVWADGRGPLELQFYSSAWRLDKGQATLQVRIDGYPAWRLKNARLFRHSVLFHLPGNRTGAKFLWEVARGNRLTLRNARGRYVHSYTLAGSSASIGALNKCVGILRGRGRDGNPFD